MAKLVFQGGKFIPSSDNTELIRMDKIYTPVTVVKNAVDPEYINDAGYVESTKSDGYLGEWNYELEKDSIIFYHVCDREESISEVILYKQVFLGNSDFYKDYYIIEINGYMYNCEPEEGDVIYTTYKEARLQFMKDMESNKIL